MAESHAQGTFDVEAKAKLIHVSHEAHQPEQKLQRPGDTWMLPAQYARIRRENLYHQGLHTGKATWEDSATNDSSLFDLLSPA